MVQPKNLRTVASLTEARTLDDLEAIIEANITATTLTVAAMARIKNERLWQHTHTTWEDYCQRRWNFTARWANQLISDQVKPKVSAAGAQVAEGDEELDEIEDDEYDRAMRDDGDSDDDTDEEWDMGDPVGSAETTATPTAIADDENPDADPEKARRCVASLTRFFDAVGEMDRFGAPLDAMSEFIRSRN